LRFLKQFHWFEIALIAVVMGVHIYGSLSAPHNFSTQWFTRDDAYYYFKVAQNISEGKGSSFDGINLTNGYHPLWMLICIPIFSLARFDLVLPLRILIVVMAGLSAATSILLFRYLKKYTGEAVAMLAASFWAFNLDVHAIITQQGMETGIVALSVVVFLTVIQKSQGKKQLEQRDLMQLGLAAIFVLFSRLDGIFLIFFAGLWIIFRRNPMRYLLSFDLLMTFFIIVGAFIQRAGLKIYLHGFDSSAILISSIVFAIQTIIFYFAGLYTHPKTLPPLRILLISVFGVTLSAFLSTLGIMVLSTLNLTNMPRAVPALYWIGMLLITLTSRFGLRVLSPWPVILSKETRPIMGLLAGKNQILLALEPLKKWLIAGTLYFGTIGSALMVYMLANQFFFGTMLPVSGQIKRWWGSIPDDVYGGGAQTTLDVFGVDPNQSQAWGTFFNPVYTYADRLTKSGWTFDGWYMLIVLVIAASWIGLFLINRKKNLRRISFIGLIPLFISAEFHAFFYGALAYAAKHEWYWVLQMLCVVIMGAMWLAMLLDLLPHIKYARAITNIAAAVMSISLAYNFAAYLIQQMPLNDRLADQPYMDILPILENNTEPGSLIGMTGGGNSGYFIKNRTIVNMDGLINSYAYFEALKENQAGKYLAKIGLDYIFANKYIITNTMPYRYQFSTDELIAVPDVPLYGQKELMRYIPTK